MDEYLIIFEDQFNAFEFMDDVDMEDITDKFSLDKYTIHVKGEGLVTFEPYTIVPFVVVLSSPIEKYQQLSDVYNGRIVKEFTIK